MKYLFISLVFLLSISSINAQKQEISNTQNYVVLTKKIPQLQPILLTAEALKAEDGSNFGDFQVIICGKTVQKLATTASIPGFLKKAESLGVQIKACGFSLNKFNVAPQSLPKGMQTVENGILHNIQLQKKGYTSIEI